MISRGLTCSFLVVIFLGYLLLERIWSRFYKKLTITIKIDRKSYNYKS